MPRFKRRRKLHRRAKKRRFVFALIITLCLFGGIALLAVESFMHSDIGAIAEVKAQQLAITVMHQTVRDRVQADVGYQDLVEVHKDSLGRVVLMQPNSLKINQLVADTTLAIQAELSKLEQEDSFIPLGEALHSPFISSYGPSVRFRVKSMGTIQVEVLDNFEAVGINQTRHSLSLHMKSQMLVIAPIMSSNIVVATTIPLAETIIVGPVPNAYFQMDTGVVEKIME